MSDFDLSQALESSTEDSEENAFESRTCIFMGVQEEILSVDVGLDLVDYIQRPISLREALPGYISVRGISMRGISMFVVALNRMKPLRNAASSDEHMDMISMEGLLDDNMVRTIVHGLASSCERKIRFRRRNSACEEYTLCDTKHKNLVQSDGNQLLATTLKGGCDDKRVKFKLTRYKPAPPNRQRPVVFTVISNNTQYHICCSGQGEEPVLMLEACSETQLEVLTAEGGMDRFLFYMKKGGMDQSRTFESVKHHGWFISTSLEEDKPVQMCQEDNMSRDIYFK